VNQKAWNKIEKMKIGNRVESDHQPLEVEARIKKERKIQNCKVERKEFVEWGEENIELYRQREEGVKMEGESMEKMWESLKKGVKECETRREIKIRKKRLGEHSWDAKCKRNKRKVYKAYRRWKKGRQGKEEYLRFSREFRENCKK